MNKVLKAKREIAGLTQVQVAKIADISESAYQNYEANKRIPSVDKALLIAQSLNSTVEELFGTPTTMC